MCRWLPFGLVLLTVWIVGSPVAAQGRPDTGGRVFGAIGGVGGSGESALLASVGAGIRVTKRLGVDFELLHARDLGLPTDIDFVIQTVGASFAPVERVEQSALTAFLTRMTVELPIANGRVWPYVTGGGGVGSLRQTVAFRNLPLSVPVSLDESLSPAIFPGPEISVRSTDLGLTIGGGVDVPLWRGLAVGGDVRHFRLLSDAEGYDFAFVTTHVSYQF